MAGRPATKKQEAKVEIKEAVKETKGVIEEIKQEPKKVVKRETPKIAMDELIRVVSLKTNPLIYVSKSQLGYQIEWDEYGSEQWIEYKELINMKNSQRAFFSKNWIICDPEILESLKVDSYYKDMIDLEDIDGLFKKTVGDLEQIISISNKGIRELIFDKALQLYKNGELDSVKIITMLKEKFDYDLELVK